MPCRAAILVIDGFTDSGLGITLDVLRTANAIETANGRPPPFRIEVASPAGGRVRAASGLSLESTRSVARLKADVLLVPGFWLEHPRDVEPSLGREDVKRAVRAIAAAHARGALVASSCAGAFLLAEAGLLDGCDATTTWWLASELERLKPRIRVDARASLIAWRRIVTGGAVFAQADVVLHVVTRFTGPSVARRCADLLLLDTHSSQAPYMAAQHLSTHDPVVEKAERLIRTRLDDPVDVATLARHVAVSPRTLARRLHAAVGLGPVAFIQRVRVEQAVLMLETSSLSLEEIAARVGYSNASTLSRLIRREAKASPQELRRKRRRLG